MEGREVSKELQKATVCEPEALHGKSFLRMLTAEKNNVELFLRHPSNHKIRICKKLSTVIILFILNL